MSRRPAAMTLLPLARYALTGFVRSQRCFAPLLAQVGFMVIFLAGPPGPARDGYAGVALLLFPVAAWLTVALLGDEDDVRRQITATHAGGPLRPLAGRLLAALAGVLALAVLTTAGPPLLGAFAPRATGADLLVGLVACTACGLAGLGLGVLAGPPLVRRPVWSITLVLVGVVLAAVWARLQGAGGFLPPPVAPVVRALLHRQAGALAVAAGAAAGFAAAAAGLHLWLAARRR